jgi:hypothetical protein
MGARVAILGFGRIGRIHAQAIDLLDGVELVSAADTLDVDGLGLDVVIVASPTPTHAEVVDGLRRRWSGRIVVEKPVATEVADTERLLGDPGVDVLYHAAYAPEVSWAARQLPRWMSDHGDLRGITMAFADPYAADLARATATLGDSWLDSGINALSVLARLVEPVEVLERREVEGVTSTFAATVACAGVGGAGVARVMTTWAAAEPSKTTRLAFADGAEAVLDHQAVLGRIADADGRIGEVFASPSAEPRLVQHYVGSFTRVLVEGRRSFPVEIDRRLHRLLLSPGGGGRTPPRSTDGRDRTS